MIPKAMDDVGIKFLCEVEGFRSCPYLDTGGTPTIGCGSTTTPTGDYVTMDTPCISRYTAIEWVNNYLQSIYKWLDDNCKWAMTQNEFNALCSFLYNTGIGAKFNSYTNTKKAIIAGDKVEIAKGMMSINNCGLLTGRRIKEIALFNTPDKELP
jgi:lysozyme